jgi:conjugal transfer/entry exclusion protein
MRILNRKFLIATALGIGTVGSLAMGLLTASTPAQAQISVFDPTNYSQNLLTAARTLTQINNQIQSLQNEAAMLINQAKNLSRIDFPQLQQLNQNLQADRPADGTGAGHRLSHRWPRPAVQPAVPQGLQQRADRQQPGRRGEGATRCGDVGIPAGDGRAIADRHQRPERCRRASRHRCAQPGRRRRLQAQQATNQLLALTAKQQFQIQNLMAAQYRAEATEARAARTGRGRRARANQEVPRDRPSLHAPVSAATS